MAEILISKVLKGEIDLDFLLRWISPCQTTEAPKYDCIRIDFITYFLNFVHEEIPSCLDKIIKTSQSCGANNLNVRLDHSLEINKSQSSCQDLSRTSADNEITTSTPKIVRISSDSVVLHNSIYASPVSPLYRNYNSFTTPKNSQHQQSAQDSGHKSPLCLGDFMQVKRPSSKKKQAKNQEHKNAAKRRINPTNLSHEKTNSFYQSENSFNFNKTDGNEISADNASEQRNVLAEERIKILSRRNTDTCLAHSPKKITQAVVEQAEVKVDPNLVSSPNQLDRLALIYGHILKCGLVLNVTSEIYFLVSLLVKNDKFDMGVGLLNDSQENSPRALFTSIHNVVYFAAKSLETQIKVLCSYDRSAMKMLAENERLCQFCPVFAAKLAILANSKAERPIGDLNLTPVQDNVCFNFDTDNRLNFPNDPSFHAFKKQRDLFYEILRLWETQHLIPGWDFAASLGGKIRSLLGLYPEPSNLVHFVRLFKAQLLSTCRNLESNELMPSLPINAEKLSMLQSRLTRKQSQDGRNSLPSFSGLEEFYRDFILVASNHNFFRHLMDCLGAEILELNDANFYSNEFDDREVDVDVATKNSYYATLKSLRLLAKFLGFIESLPYKTDCNAYSAHLLTMHLKIRRQTQPSLDLKTILQDSIQRGSVILTVPWICKYLAMLDFVTLRLPYYTALGEALFNLYRHFDSPLSTNVHLVKFCLGWLFELPHFPDIDHLNDRAAPKIDRLNTSCEGTSVTLDQIEIVDQNILNYCCPYLGDIKNVLMTNSGNNSVTIKHITPVTAAEPLDVLTRKKLEHQLEEAFYNGQPVSTRKTVEFVSERLASACVKHICYTAVPNFKKTVVKRFRSTQEEERIDSKDLLKAKAQQFAASCFKELLTHLNKEIDDICNRRIPNAIESLGSLETPPKTKEICVRLTKKSCTDRVQQWIKSHVSAGIFNRELEDEISKLLAAGKKVKRDRPTFSLPSGGKEMEHNEDTVSAASLVDGLKSFSIAILERRTVIDESQFLPILDNICRCINERCDVNDCVLATICTSLLDIFLLLMAHYPQITTQDSVLFRVTDIWKLYYNGCDDLFKSLLCHRTVAIFSQSDNVSAAWEALARFCAYLIQRKLLACVNMEAQCTGIFKTEWDKVSLQHITDFFKLFVKLYKESGGGTDDFAFLLDFLSDYCADL